MSMDPLCWTSDERHGKFSWHSRVFACVDHRRERDGSDSRNSNASAATNVEYPSPNMKKTGTTEQALLTNQKPEPRARRPPSESATLATPLIIYCISSMSFSGW
uniref:Uncharacterized protein n=1 Tax=Mesocestoides corti TaxID=53468 RepID=A0A5K3FR78_MESCO